MNHSTVDVVFHYLRYACIHYEVSKANKKKMKQLIEAMPYFLPDKYQNLFFDLIHTYPLHCYWDSCESIQDYGYMIYSSFHKKLKKSFKSREDYDQEMYNTNYGNHKRIHSIIFFMITIVLMYILYRLR